MASDALIIKNFDEFAGVNYRDNDVTRTKEFASDAINSIRTRANSLTCRKGQKAWSPSRGGCGNHSFTRVNADGTVQQEFLTMDSELWRKKVGTITVSYSGAADNNSFAMIPVQESSLSTTYKVYVEEGNAIATSFYWNPAFWESGYFEPGYLGVSSTAFVNQLEIDVGFGKNEASPYTLADLKTEVDALANFAMSIDSGPTDFPVAMIPIIPFAVVDAGLVIEFEYFEQIECPTTTPFLSFNGDKNKDTFENAVYVDTSNACYIATGKNKLYKYDGDYLYAAGMPIGVIDSAVEDTAGTTFAQDEYRIWMVTYEQKDRSGRFVNGDGNVPIERTIVDASGADMDLQIPFIQPSSEFLTYCGVAASAQSGTTITVNGGHSLIEGMTAYFENQAGDEQEVVIDSIAGNNITFASSITIPNGGVFSANLRVNLWRNKAGGSLLYLVKTFANNSLTTNMSFKDDVADNSLVIEYDYPVKGHGEPPTNLKYLAVHEGLLVGTSGTDRIHHSDVDGPEYFVQDQSSFLLRSESNDPVSGINSHKEVLVVTKENETHVVAGDLPESRFRQELVAKDMGCVAFHTMKEIQDSLWFLSKDGVYRIIAGSRPTEMSFRILPVFTEPAAVSEQQFIFKRAIAENYHTRQLYCLYLPAEQETGGNTHPNAFSRVFTADYREQYQADKSGKPYVRWWPWDNINMAGGVTMHDDKLVWSSREYSEDITAMEYLHYEFREEDDQYDYHDHGKKFSWDYASAWLTLDEPSVKKKASRGKVYSIAERTVPAFDMTITSELDYFDGNTDTKVDMSFGETSVSSGWGVEGYGQEDWGDFSTFKEYFNFLPTWFDSLRLRFRANVFLQQPLMSGWEIETLLPFKRKIKE